MSATERGVSVRDTGAESMYDSRGSVDTSFSFLLSKVKRSLLYGFNFGGFGSLVEMGLECGEDTILWDP